MKQENSFEELRKGLINDLGLAITKCEVLLEKLEIKEESR